MSDTDTDCSLADTRAITVFECDHLRPLARDDNGIWRHINANGGLASPCGASSVYRLDVTASDPEQLHHTLGKWVSQRDVKNRQRGGSNGYE